MSVSSESVQPSDLDVLAASSPATTALGANCPTNPQPPAASQTERAVGLLALAERTVRWEDNVTLAELRLFESLYLDVLRQLRLDPQAHGAAAPAERIDRSALLQLRAQACAAVRHAQQAQRGAAHWPTRHWLRDVLAALALLLFGAFAMRASLAEWFDWGNVSRGKPWIASSRYANSVPLSGVLTDFSAPFFFHTAYEENPWLEIDLGQVVSVHSVAIDNRVDCCSNRASPLVIETSRDHQQWRVAATQRNSFDRWRAALHGQPTRWLRLRVLRESHLHLKAVVVRK